MTSNDAQAPAWVTKRWPFSPEAIRLVELVWAAFREKRRWPSRREVILAGNNEHLNAVELVRTRQGLWAEGDDPSVLVRPDLGALLHNPEVRTLLAPTPAVLREACARFIANPNYGDGKDTLEIPFSEVKQHWESDADLALALMRQLETPLQWTKTTIEMAWLQPKYSALRFESVRTLEEVFAATERNRIIVTNPLHTSHQRLINAIWKHVSSRFEWPLSVPFAIEQRALGYVPSLVEDFDSAGHVTTFGGQRTSRLELRLQAIDALGPAVVGIALRIVQGAADLWTAAKNPLSVPVADVAKRVGESIETTAPVLMLLKWEPWMRTLDADGPLENWRVPISDSVFRYSRATTWLEYVAMAHPPEVPPAPPPVFTSGAIPILDDTLSLDIDAVAAAPSEDEHSRLVRLLAARGIDLGEPIGRGGSARVYSAQHRTLGPRAVKVFAPFQDRDATTGAHERPLERFAREARVLDRLSSPSILKIYDAHLGEAPRFIVTELAPGNSLRRHVLESGPMGVEVALRVADQLLGALEVVHAARVFHRDISDNNVMFDQGTGKVTLIDFGLSGFLEAQLTSRLTTASGVGTPGFSAPELVTHPTTSAPTVDIFSVGAVFHSILLGRPPRATGVDDEELGRIPAALIDPLRRAIQLNPAARFQTASAMRAALHRAREQVSSVPFAPISADGLPGAVGERESRKSAGATFELTLDYEKKASGTTSNHHAYEFVARLTNNGTKRIDDWEIQLEFPTRIRDGVSYGTEVVQGTPPGRSRFRATGARSGEALRPGEHKELRIGYQVTTAIYAERETLFAQLALATALVDGETAGRISRPISELQNF